MAHKFINTLQEWDQPNRSYTFSRWLYLRALGLIYLVAFISLWVQIEGLIGSHGILPVSHYLQRLADTGYAFRIDWFPTLLWINASDVMLHLLCGLGVLFSLFLMVDFAPAWMLFLLWCIYLSLSVGGQVFMQYQWDSLLLETGFISIFLAPWQIFPEAEDKERVSNTALWLLRILLLKLMFESGVVKWASGDETWRHFTALTFHCETQPLPTIFGWLAHQLPALILNIGTALVFVFEIILPLFILTTRKLRQVAAFGIAFFMGIIFLTGNYGSFNLLTIALCIPLLDDRFFKNVIPWNWADKHRHLPKLKEPFYAKNILMWSFAVLFFFMPLAEFQGIRRNSNRFLTSVAGRIESFRTINNYGLFANMTQTRPEIVVQGSRDGEHWKTYRFKYKAGALDRAPVWVQPHMPRLDWQMWFAALGSYRQNPWFIHFLIKLLQGDQTVTNLLADNPFPDPPPKMIRAVLYNYQFTNIPTLYKTGNWWKREREGMYVPAFSLDDIQRDFR